MQNAAKGMASGWTVNWVNPGKRSNTEKTEPPPSVSSTLTTRGIAICGISVTLFQFLVVDSDSDADRLFWDAYQGARPRGSGMLDEADSNVGIEDGIDLL